MRTARTSTRTRRWAAALALVAAGIGAAALLALPAHAGPALPALPAAPQVLPLDTGDGLLGAPRGTVPSVATPDLTGIPAAEQLPGLGLAPLPAPAATGDAPE